MFLKSHNRLSLSAQIVLGICGDGYQLPGATNTSPKKFEHLNYNQLVDKHASTIITVRKFQCRPLRNWMNAVENKMLI